MHNSDLKNGHIFEHQMVILFFTFKQNKMNVWQFGLYKPKKNYSGPYLVREPNVVHPWYHGSIANERMKKGFRSPVHKLMNCFECFENALKNANPTRTTLFHSQHNILHNTFFKTGSTKNCLNVNGYHFSISFDFYFRRF